MAGSVRLARLAIGACILGPAAVSAVPVRPTFTSCLDEYAPIAAGAARLNVSSIYANLVSAAESTALGINGAGYDVLRVDLIGDLGQELLGYDNTTGKLATLFTSTSAASIDEYTSATWLCNSLFPSSLPEPYTPDNVTYCPLPAGDFAINLSIPLFHSHALTTLRTQVRMVDTSVPALTLACVNVDFTPYTAEGWYYDLFLWFPAALAIAYWITTWAARFAAGWVVGEDRSGVGGYEREGMGRREARLRKWGTMFISGLSGERLGVSGALLRFDIIAHIQFATSLGMIAVSWPAFFYPIVTQSAWADLVWNVTLTQTTSEHPAQYPTSYSPPSAFASMMSDSYYPLYLDSAAANPLLDLYGVDAGMASLAAVVGLRPQDLFCTCIVVFLMVTAAIVVISLALWATHAAAEYSTTPRTTRSAASNPNRASLGAGSRTSSNGKEWFDSKASSELGMLPTQASLAGLGSSRPSRVRRTWARFTPKGEAGAFHFAALYGNLLRLVLVFHLPITAFAVYQLTLGARASVVSRVFAALAFVGISVAIPAFIMFKISRTPTGKLYEAARTLLSLGPAYNVYEQERQLFRAVPLGASLVSGIVLGAGQKSGLAQAVVLIVVELAALIAPTFWLPWGEGASMGAPMAIVGIARVASVVLAMVLSPQVSGIDSNTESMPDEQFNLSEAVQQWLAYVVLLLQALVFVFFFFMVLTKIVEGVIRLFGGAHFDESTHPLDGGLFAAIMDLDCLNPVRGGKAAARKRRKRGSRQLQRNVSAAGSLTTQQILDRHSLGVQRDAAPPMTPVFPPVDPASEAAQRGTYFPVVGAPMLSPASERVSSDSRSDGPSDGHGPIMDAWRPGPATPPFDVHAAPMGYLALDPYGATPPPARLAEPPMIRISAGDSQRSRPAHNRTRSSSGVVGIIAPSAPPSMPGSPVSPAGGLRPNNEGLRPPKLAIPKRRSLNSMRDDSPTSGSDSTSRRNSKERDRAKAAARARGGAGGGAGAAGAGSKSGRSRHAWFSSTDSDTDDEPGPSRRRGRAAERLADDDDDDDEYGRRRRGWRGLLGLRERTLDEMAEQARDENSARKAKAVNEMGALLAGVQPAPAPPGVSATSAQANGTVSSFKVNRKGKAASQPAGAGPSGTAITAGAPPAQAAAAAASSQPQEPARSFRVIRPGRPALPPHMQHTQQASDASASAASAYSAAPALQQHVQSPSAASSSSPTPTLVGGPPPRSFRVIRPATSPTVSSSFVVHRPSTSPTATVQHRSSLPPGPIAQRYAQPAQGQDGHAMPLAPPLVSTSPPSSHAATGYPPTSFVPIDMSRTISNDSAAAPPRPMKNPRRSSEEYRH